MVKTFEQEHISDSMRTEICRVCGQAMEWLTRASIVDRRVAHCTCTRSIKLFINDIGSNIGINSKSEGLYNLLDTNSFYTYWNVRGRFLYRDCYHVRNFQRYLVDCSSLVYG